MSSSRRRALLTVAVALAVVGSVGTTPGAQGLSDEAAIRLGGSPLQLLSARGSLWVLTCDRRCSGEARGSVGRLVRIDPRRGRVTASITITRPGAIAVGSAGVYLTDFWRDGIRRLDPATLRETARVRVRLPFQITAGDHAFLPEDLAVGADATWVATARCALARVDQAARRQVALLRLPCDAYQTMAVGVGAVWVSESLAGLYRIDPSSNHVVARIQIGPPSGRLVVTRLLPIPGGKVLAVGVWTKGGALTDRNGLVRIEANRNRVGATHAAANSSNNSATRRAPYSQAKAGSNGFAHARASTATRSATRC